jgi:UTP-glucose-1-phosphate uridylyltransferase
MPFQSKLADNPNISYTPSTNIKTTVDVVVAAGGLGTRVHTWSRFIPKEFYPINHRPAILYLFDEIAALGATNIYFVYHPYYEPFIAWVRHLLAEGGRSKYDAVLGGLGKSIPSSASLEGMNIQFIPESGPYCDVSSLFSCMELLRSSSFYLAFSDMLYLQGHSMTGLLNIQGEAPIIMTTPFDIKKIARQGLIVARKVEEDHEVVDIVEKPEREVALQLVRQWGEENLFMLEGRFKLTKDFLDSISFESCVAGAEPKLSYALRNYARSNAVKLMLSDDVLTDVGVSLIQTPHVS